jgi:hypothetical protein
MICAISKFASEDHYIVRCRAAAINLAINGSDDSRQILLNPITALLHCKLSSFHRREMKEVFKCFPRYGYLSVLIPDSQMHHNVFVQWTSLTLVHTHSPVLPDNWLLATARQVKPQSAEARLGKSSCNQEAGGASALQNLTGRTPAWEVTHFENKDLRCR